MLTPQNINNLKCFLESRVQLEMYCRSSHLAFSLLFRTLHSSNVGSASAPGPSKHPVASEILEFGQFRLEFGQFGPVLPTSVSPTVYMGGRRAGGGRWRERGGLGDTVGQRRMGCVVQVGDWVVVGRGGAC